MALRMRSDTAFFWLASCTWILFFLWVEPQTFHALGLVSSVIFAFAASFVSYCVLRLLGYFDVLRIVPRKSDLLLVLTAMPVGGLVMCGFFRYLNGDPNLCGYPPLLYGAPILTLVVFGGHYAFSKVLLARGRTRKVVLDVLPFEAQILLSDFQAHGLDTCVEFLTRRDLQIHMRAGKKDIDLVIISRRATQHFKGNPWLLRAHLAGIPVMDYRTVTASLSGRCRLADADLWSYVLAARPQTHFLRLYTQAKRIIEPAIALMLAVLLAPVMAAVAIAIRTTSPGPVLYRQVRAGFKGRPFTLLKFRSMVQDSEKNGPQWARENDCRVTPVGAFIRKTRLDELPQLWNVFVGDMSFCGPRPERPEIYARLEDQIPIFSLRTIVRPGITGWAQVFAGYAASVEESLLKMEYDLFYIQHMSPRLDLVILIQTIWVAIFGDAQASNQDRVQEVKDRSARILDLIDSTSPDQVLEAANG